MLSLAAIHLYPIKSLDGVTVQECRVLPNGALEHDRSLALFDRDGNFVNGKRHPAIHRLRAQFALPRQLVTLSSDSQRAEAFHLREQLPEMAAWFSDYFGFAIEVRRHAEGGFPDDVAAPGPTVISTATLRAVAEWFPQLAAAEMGRRFRANLDMDAPEPFWEDRLFGPHQAVRFRIGEVEFLGTNPCARCVVPSRSPEDGSVLTSFARIVSEQRERTLPSWAAATRFDHFYRIAVNTRLSQLGGGKLRVGDELQIVDE